MRNQVSRGESTADTPLSLWAWSACVGSISVAASGVSTMWLPWPWDAIAWVVLAIVLCTVGGLLYPVNDLDIATAGPIASLGAWSADARDLLDLFAMASEARELGDFVLSLIPYSKPPSWRHPRRRICDSATQGRRAAELMAEANWLVEAGLLRCVKRGHGWRSLGVYKITDAGRAACEAPCGLTEGAS